MIDGESNADESVFCVNCKWRMGELVTKRQGLGNISFGLFCTHPKATITVPRTHDPVTGVLLPAHNEYESCASERFGAADGTICGLAGAWFEPKA
jgi:hypothetical protein